MPDISEMYSEVSVMLKDINKTSYAANMTIFCEKYGAVLDFLFDTVEKSGPEASAERFVESVAERFSTKGKIPAYLQVDLNSFTVYYVMPAIDLSGHPQSGAFIREICAVWGKRFRYSSIHFAAYDTILNSFQRTLLGIRI